MLRLSRWWACRRFPRLERKTRSLSEFMPFTVAQIAEKLKGEVIGDGSIEIRGLAPAEHARSGELTFADNANFFALAEQSQAAAILVSEPFASARKTLIRVPSARVAMARVLPVFFPPEQHPQGIHPS